jgi:hypothetical protein
MIIMISSGGGVVTDMSELLCTLSGNVRPYWSIIVTNMARELLGVRLRQQGRYHLLSIRNGSSKAF